MDQGKNPRTKSAPKCSVQEASGLDQVGATMGCPWWWMHGRVAWDAWPCGPCPQAPSFSFAAFRFLGHFFGFGL